MPAKPGCQLVDDGEEAPTIARVAEHAGLSLATAYRYYSDTLLLLRDAFSAQWPELPAMVEQLGTLRDAGSRARAAAEAMARHVLAKEPFVRTVLRLAHESGENARPAFRFLLIDRVLEVATGDAAEKRTLRLGLATLISAEAVFALKDTRECDDEELVATLGWAAEAAGEAPLSWVRGPRANHRRPVRLGARAAPQDVAPAGAWRHRHQLLRPLRK